MLAARRGGTMSGNRFLDYMRQGDETFLTTKVDSVINWAASIRCSSIRS
jgi:hypothetical protein